mgnify:CR=1 FL=1
MGKFYALLRAALAPPTIFFIFVYSFPVVVFFRSHTVFIPQKFLYTASSTSKLGTSVIFCRFWLILRIFDEIWPFFPVMCTRNCWIWMCSCTTNWYSTIWKRFIHALQTKQWKTAKIELLDGHFCLFPAKTWHSTEWLWTRVPLLCYAHYIICLYNCKKSMS